MHSEESPDKSSQRSARALVPPTRRAHLSRRWILAIIGLIVIAVTFVVGVYPRLEARAALKKETANRNIQNVAVIKPKASNSVQELELPGNIQPYSESAIYARTSGYIRRWYADIGTTVKAGQLLAEIDTPEIDDQLRQARAELETANSNFQFAESTAARWEALLKTGSVSRQEVDEKRNDFAAKKTVFDAARFNVARLEKTQSFKRLYAPFDGVITARNTDVGALINAGSSAKELFHLASIKKLRVSVYVPQEHAHDIVIGMNAELTLPEIPGHRFKGSVARTAESIDPTLRTLLAEIDVDNTGGQLLPGSYSVVHLKINPSYAALTLPVNTLLYRPEGVMIAVLQQDRAVLVPIKLGRDYGSEIDVVSGLNATDSVIINPSDSLVSGVQVRLVPESAAKGKE